MDDLFELQVAVVERLQSLEVRVAALERGAVQPRAPDAVAQAGADGPESTDADSAALDSSPA
jgi:hypothetical protein